MKSYINLFYLVIVVLSLTGCKKEELRWMLTAQRAIVRTELSTEPTPSSFKAKGEVELEGDAPVTERGFCWSLDETPTIEDNKITVGSGMGAFEIIITGLTPDQKYYHRAYAINAHGTWYGETKFQSTFPGRWPDVITQNAVVQDSFYVKLTGAITDDGGYPDVRRGFCYSLSPAPDTTAFVIPCGTGAGAFDTLTPVLSPGTWHFRAYGINEKGIWYGANVSVNIVASPGPGGVPIVTTREPTNVSSFSFRAEGEVLNDMGSPVTETGFVYSTSPNPDLTDMVKTTVNPFYNIVAIINSLNDSTTYYFKAYATNAYGTGYGEEKMATTPAW